ncbi:MAG: hypothetical protein CMJ40_03360 [Phycisphaerae bacterium]|nr:hypothetical protein [Phycisphaerae bacterium]|tara:strand:+ start:1002 stop:1436 length:435 start_codon:yes stop_codon:yes gene_type:complete
MIAASILAVTLSACGKKEEANSPEPVPETTGIAADPAHEAQVDMITHDFTAGQTKLSLSASGTAEPNAEIHMTINHISGPRPDVIRTWFGPRSGEGTMKTKAGGHDDHWHAHVVCPGTITSQDSLWVEIQYANGDKAATSIRIK